jgi:hypothetical protein
MRRLGPAIGVILLLATACSIDGNGENTIRGSGDLITETRSVTGFDEISVEGFGEVIVEVGPAESLTVEAEDNVIPYLITRVSGGTLKIGAEGDTSFRDVEQPVFRITMPELTGVSISGSGSVTATGIDTDSFDVSISGSGDVHPEGRVIDLSVSISGSGEFDGENLRSADAAVDISGSGSATVDAADTLDIEIGGSGNVTYLGDPAITQSIGGSGTVRRR